MNDYVDRIKSIKETEGLQDRAVIVGGGSYGGMLSAWLRMKYPQWFQGALAASAPILFFDGYVAPDAYDIIATGSYAASGTGETACSDLISDGFAELADLRANKDAYGDIAEIFNLCAVPEGEIEVQSLIDTLSDSIGTMAMVNYPYPTSFVEPLPAWPVATACAAGEDAWNKNWQEKYAKLYPIQAVGKTFYNYNDQEPCLDVSVQQGGGLDDNGWGVQACNEMAMPFSSPKPASMFPPAEWNEKENSAQCEAMYGESPQYNWALEYFGGINPKKDFMKASNIIFSNGTLDPWHAGGVLEQVSDETISIFIEESAHHLDLRLPNEADPATLTAARATEMEWIAKFIDQYQGTNFVEQLAENKTQSFLQ